MATGWFWFCGMLVPVIGLVQVGAQSMADRYTYLPLIGVFIIVVWGADEIFACRGFSPATAGITAGLILLACGWRAGDQLSYWQNSETLGRHTLAVTTNNWIADYNLGYELDRQGQIDEALEHYRRAVAVKPFDADCLNRLGFDLTKKGRYAEALPLFETALQARPAFLDLHYNIATALLHLGRYDEAIEHYRTFLEHHPGHAPALSELGVSLGLRGDYDQAIVQFREALRYQPDNPETHFNLGKALALQGTIAEAKIELTEALRLKPGWTEAKDELDNLEKPAK